MFCAADLYIGPSMSFGSSQRIGLLGGSFNPPHDGHVEISLTALNWLKLDAVWWLVTPGNPLKNPDVYAPYEERLCAARQIIKDDRIVVSNFEERRNLQYTAETLSALNEDFPAMKFVWLMGADSLRDFHRWRDWRKIAALAPIAVFNRPGFGDDALRSETAQALAHFRLDAAAAETLCDSEPPAWIFYQATDNPISSTELRQTSKR